MFCGLDAERGENVREMVEARRPGGEEVYSLE